MGGVTVIICCINQSHHIIRLPVKSNGVMFTSAYSRSRATSGFLSQVPKEGKSIFYRCTGCKVDEDFSEHVYKAGERIMRYYGNIGKRIGEHFAEKAQELIEMYKADEKMVVQSILSLVGKQFLLHIGASDLHNVSLASWQYYINMGEDLNVEGYVICSLIRSQKFLLSRKPNNSYILYPLLLLITTYCLYPRVMFQMVEKLVEDFPKECLLLNKAVSKIKWDGAFCGKEGQV